MSAVVLPFMRERQPATTPSAYAFRERQQVTRDARLIRNLGKSPESALMFGILQVMDADQRMKLELALSKVAHDPEAEPALALVRFVNSAPARKREVSSLVTRMSGGPF